MNSNRIMNESAWKNLHIAANQAEGHTKACKLKQTTETKKQTGRKDHHKIWNNPSMVWAGSQIVTAQADYRVMIICLLPQYLIEIIAFNSSNRQAGERWRMAGRNHGRISMQSLPNAVGKKNYRTHKTRCPALHLALMINYHVYCLLRRTTFWVSFPFLSLIQSLLEQVLFNGCNELLKEMSVWGLRCRRRSGVYLKESIYLIFYSLDENTNTPNIPKTA